MHVLFLCVANSARSQMAEGMARFMAPNGVTVSSAGSAPSSVNPLAVEALSEIGVPHEGASSTNVADVNADEVDVVVTLCADEVCPAWLSERAERKHWPVDDPAAGDGTHEERLERFREARERIREHLREYFQRMDGELP